MKRGRVSRYLHRAQRWRRYRGRWFALYLRTTRRRVGQAGLRVAKRRDHRHWLTSVPNAGPPLQDWPWPPKLFAGTLTIINPRPTAALHLHCAGFCETCATKTIRHKSRKRNRGRRCRASAVAAFVRVPSHPYIGKCKTVHIYAGSYAGNILSQMS